MTTLRKKAWSPYVVGIFIGLLTWFALLSADHLLGITTAFEYTAALLLKPVAGSSEYFSKETPIINWEWMLVLGVFLGAFLSSRLSGDRNHPVVPGLWKKRFGNRPFRRLLMAFSGAALMMYGARVAQGCTSGHGISGVLQFAVSSWIFVLVFGLTGILVAKLLYSGTKD